MKNFYELTTIDTKKKLVVYIELVLHDNPIYTFTVNDLVIDKLNCILYFDLFETLNFFCKVKKGAIEIKKITINDKEVMPIYLSYAEPKTSWITEDWTLNIFQPFYPWYHKITGQGWIA